jgi:hypothetical protein
MPYRLICVAAVLLCLAADLLATAPVQIRWRRIDTPNFVVVGDVSAGDLRDVGTRFEGFRDALGRILNDRLVATVVPAVIVVFSTDDMYKPYKPRFGGRSVEVSGVFMPGRDVHYITIGDREHLETLFHEYTHLLVGNTGLTMPLWLGEGLAEYYSTLEFQRSGREVQVGGLIADHLARLNDTVLIPLDQFLQLSHDSPLYNEGSRRSVFYAQAWAMTHMLHLGKPDRRAELNRYLQRVTSGMSSLEAWKEAFAGVDVMKDLQSYIRQQLFTAHKYRLDEKTTSFEKIPAVELSTADAEAFLNQLLVRLREYDAAAARLAAARKRDPVNPRLRVTEAMLAMAKNEHGRAAEQLAGVTSNGDWLLAYQAGVLLADVMERERDALTPENLSTVRAHLAASAQSRPVLPHAAYRVASLEIRGAGVSAETKAALNQARGIAPGRHEYQLLYAQVLGRSGDFDAAREILGPMMSPQMPPHVREVARRVMGSIVDAQIGKPLADVPLDSVASRVTTSDEFVREPVTRPVFRETKPGETRMDGVLQSIECVAGKGITFHLRAGDRAELFTVPTFDEVDFITYRSDLTGNIECGPLKTPMPVYLTWRAGSAPGTRVPVAIEFLPVKVPAAVH